MPKFFSNGADGKRYSNHYPSDKAPKIIAEGFTKQVVEVYRLIPPGTPNRTKLIKAELRKRGIIR